MSPERFEEPLLIIDKTKYCQLPIKFPKLQKAYEEHEAMFWSSKEIDYASDVKEDDEEICEDNESDEEF